MATSTRFYPNQKDYIEQLNQMDDTLNAGGGGGGSGPEFTSNVFRVKDTTDPTKKISFNLTGITANNTRSYILPNSDATLAAVNVGQTWTENQVFNPNRLKIAGATSGDITLNAPAVVGGSFTLTLPAQGTIPTLANVGTQTFLGAVTVNGALTATLTGNVTGNVTGAVTGNASTATALQTARTINGTSFDGTANISFNTGAVAEGSNLYYTQARFDTAFGNKTTTNLAEGTNLYYTQARFDTAFGNKTTANLAENTNLYYTNTRARSAISLVPGSTGATYNSTTGVLDLSAVPVGGDMVTTATQTVSGAKTFNSGTLKLAGATSGALTLNAPDIAGTGTVNLPQTGTLATTAELLTSFNRYTPRTANPPIDDGAVQPSVPTVDWIQTISTNGLTARQDWAGNGQEVFITMDDGTEFVRYPSTGSFTDTLLRSPAGGSDGTTAWTVQYTTTNCLEYSILLRDPTNDTCLHFVATGSSMKWSLRCRAISSAGTVLADVTMPYNGFLEGLSVNPYIRGGIEPTTGKFVLVQAAQYWGGQSMQRTQTLQNVMYFLRGKFTKTSGSSGTFAFEERKQMLMPERTAYHIPFMGLNGDPDFMCGLMGRDVLITEDTDYATNLKGSYAGGGSGWYNFDQVGYFWYNFRTREGNWKWITPRTGFLTSDCIVRASWAAGSTSITINQILSGTIRRGQQIVGAVDNSGNTDFTNEYIGSSAGTVGTAVPIVTSFGGTTAVSTSGNAGGTDVLLRLVENAANVPTPQARYVQAIPSNDGYVWFVYNRTRHDASATVAMNAKVSYRIVKMSAYGDVIFDEEFISEFSSGSAGSISFGNHMVVENSNNQKYVIRIGNGPNQTQFHFCKIKETLTDGATSGASSTSGSQDVTIPAGATGDWYPGMYVYGSAWASGYARITNWKTYTPGNAGTIVVDSNANSTVSGTLSLTSRGVVGVEPPIAGNSINGSWGTSGSYLGIPQALPARAAGFVAWTCDDRSGSRVRKFRMKCAVSRKVNDHPTNTSGTADQKIDMVNVRLP